MEVLWIEHKRNGTKLVTRKNYDTGQVDVLSDGVVKQVSSGREGYWQLSVSNGVPSRQLQKAKRIDHELGVPIDYVQKGPMAMAAFTSASQKRKWLRAHKRVDMDAGYRDPCPGDFVKD